MCLHCSIFSKGLHTEVSGCGSPASQSYVSALCLLKIVVKVNVSAIRCSYLIEVCRLIDHLTHYVFYNWAAHFGSCCSVLLCSGLSAAASWSAFSGSQIEATCLTFSDQDGGDKVVLDLAVYQGMQDDLAVVREQVTLLSDLLQVALFFALFFSDL